MAARCRTAAYTWSSRPGSVPRMNACASSIAPWQSEDHHGCAHSVITEENPASLPPTVIVTQRVAPSSPPSWLFTTSATRAPEHAAKVSAAPIRAASRTG